jgi:LAS superfamily LD-carboxypeptidase LdcB
MKNSGKHIDAQKILTIAGILVAVSGITLWSYYTYALADRLQFTEHTLASSTAMYSNLARTQRERIAVIEKEKEELFDSLSDEERKRRKYQRLANQQEDEIDTLTKLTTLDPELLKKYSKVYFLSENYLPPELEYINSAYLIDPARKLTVLAQVHPFLNEMIDDATDDGIPLRITSAYRSFDTQKDLKTAYSVIFGAGTANQFSAEQGYSEHQLGSTVDFTTPTIKGAHIDFENTTAFKWLMDNGYKYGFVLSYPKGNAYYQYEPWHWRFVGKSLAGDLHNANKYFYEYEQRAIDEYLIKIFDR